MRSLIYSRILPSILRFSEIAKDYEIETAAVLVPYPNDSDDEEKNAAINLAKALHGNLEVCMINHPSEVLNLVKKIKPDLGFCNGFRWKLSAETLDAHRFGVLNSHPSLLPIYRGPCAIPWAIRNADAVIGSTLLLMDQEYDSGPIFAQKAIPMPSNTSPEILIPQLNCILEELPLVIQRIINGEKGLAQDDSKATYAPLFGPDYQQIDWQGSRADIDRQIRAWQWMPKFSKIKGPTTILGNKWVSVVSASSKPTPEGNQIRMQCADGPLWIKTTELIDS